jgi:hypothetical protein
MANEFEIREGCLLKLHPESAEPIAIHEPFATKVVQCAPIGDRVVVREDYYCFPRGQSNVYCLDENFRLIWKAELPSSTDVYANPVLVTDAGLVCASWEGDTCTLDGETGRIRSRVFTK